VPFCPFKILGAVQVHLLPHPPRSADSHTGRPPEPNAWQKACSLMLEAGFTEAKPFNPYWELRGPTFQDHDGYVVGLEQASWTSR